ncbi:MAG: chemotaxis protein CheX [Desulfovibrionales bacterium]|jgi:chemotaxis protein CheX|nr:chemotaxis protein CheX [Desulfovibrionales bacterium]
MDPMHAKPFIKATREVLMAMANFDVTAGTPYIKKDRLARGDVSAVIGITGEKNGTFSISFDRQTAIHLVRQILGDAIEDILYDVQDAVGEIANMISGQARVGLAEMGIKLQGSTPSVVMGDNHTIVHMTSSLAIAIPFTSDAGQFTLEFCFE